MAETPDELAFRKGDLLTVLEQNTSGLEGWWLCKLRGRQVILWNALDRTQPSTVGRERKNRTTPAETVFFIELDDEKRTTSKVNTSAGVCVLSHRRGGAKKTMVPTSLSGLSRAERTRFPFQRQRRGGGGGGAVRLFFFFLRFSFATGAPPARPDKASRLHRLL